MCIRDRKYSTFSESSCHLFQSQKLTNKKFIYSYKCGVDIPLTSRQIILLSLISKGFSNIKIARILLKKETSIKLSIHRIIKYIEFFTCEKLDRYSIIIFAQELVKQNKLDV